MKTFLHFFIVSIVLIAGASSYAQIGVAPTPPPTQTKEHILLARQVNVPLSKIGAGTLILSNDNGVSLAAVAIPAFMKNARKAKTAEATTNVKKMYDGARMATPPTTTFEASTFKATREQGLTTIFTKTGAGKDVVPPGGDAKLKWSHHTHRDESGKNTIVEYHGADREGNLAAYVVVVNGGR